MKEIILNPKLILKYITYLTEEERSVATIKKYERDILKFYVYLPETKVISKDSILQYKASLYDAYKPSSMNSMLVALNGFLEFLNLNKWKVKLHKLQKRVFADHNKELTKQEYMRLLTTAQNHNDDRLFMLLQAICATGIRVSEHKYITYEAIQAGKAEIYNKGKVREIYIDKKLQKILMSYCKRRNIKSGSVFVSKKGKALDRSNIWKMMKKLCKDANVDSEKVFPHNLRHLFAFTYYRIEKDLVRLAGLLGHSNIETTRIYTMSKGSDCMRSVSKLGLLLIE